MQKIIDVCSRVEGHSQINYFIQNDELQYADYQISAFRGFENILLGKKLQDVPKIISRVCGLCHASQTIASCKAIEDIFNIGVSKQSAIIRRLLMTGELIKSHTMHFFLQSIPDLLHLFQKSDKILNNYELTQYNPDLTQKCYELIKIGNDIDRLYGGRPIHGITSVPGGVIYTPSTKNILLAQKYLQKALNNLEFLIEFFTNNFSSIEPPKYFSLPDKLTFLAMNNGQMYDRYKGSLSILNKGRSPTNFSLTDYSKYFDKDSDLRGINKMQLIDGELMVGPLARYHIVRDRERYNEMFGYLERFSEKWKNNLLFLNFLRLIEMHKETKDSLDLIEQDILNQKISLPPLRNAEKNEGLGLVEAPRGTLFHYYHINHKNIIDKVKLFIATEFNIPLMNEMITRYAKTLYEKEDIETLKPKVQMIIRTFDPCISCATH